LFSGYSDTRLRELPAFFPHLQPDPDFETAIAIMIAIKIQSGKIGNRF